MFFSIGIICLVLANIIHVVNATKNNTVSCSYKRVKTDIVAENFLYTGVGCIIISLIIFGFKYMP